ncbi:glycosyltransferase family 2 protein [Caballeronia grimmiae]|uniref:glycosyltransferase family 2 protein n=1 Tax=Caballeronia grimmiae TaxID=1071679 RepID=UPI0038B81ACA
MSQPRISVLMPVHNGEAFIEEAIQSILQQRYRNFELLIINDGSDDQTHAIATRISQDDPRVQLLFQEKAGIVAALNLGISHANGRYLARMDADDVAHPMRLSIQLERMEAEPRLVACGTDIVKFGRSFQYVSTPATNEECKALLTIESCFAHPTVMMRAQVIQQRSLQYRADDKYVEDYRLWTELATHGEFANISLPLLRYRTHHDRADTWRTECQRDAHVRIASQMLQRHGCPIESGTLREFLWPSDSGVKKAVEYFLSTGVLAQSINATAPGCDWLRGRTRRIRVRNTMKMAARKNV